MLDKSFPSSLYYHGVTLKRPRDRQHGDINPDPPATAQLQHAITWKPYGLVPFFGYKYHTVALVNNSYFNILLCLQLILETYRLELSRQLISAFVYELELSRQMLSVFCL